MENRNEIMKSIQQLDKSVKELSTRVELLAQAPALKIPQQYLTEGEVLKMLHIKSRTLAKLRTERNLRCYRSGHKFLYLHQDIHEYLLKNCQQN
jgi:hypothetical protein